MPERSDRPDKGELLQQLTELQRVAEQRALLNADPAFPAESDELVARIRQLIDSIGALDVTGSLSTSVEEDRDLPPASALAASRGLSASDVASLRDHVINLNEGQFSQDAQYSTKPEDVDRIFQQSIPTWMDQLGGKKANIVFYAHGGLTDETAGLTLALEHVPWWKENGVYPIYFIWQTGFWQTVGHLLQGLQQRSVAVGARDFFDHTTDPALEGVARLLGGPLIWGGMKRSAELASSPGADGTPEGGAHYSAQRLSEFLKKSGGNNAVDVHAVGHSAGSIFHAYFIPSALKAGVNSFKTLQFLAPAIRVDTFKRTLFPIVKDQSGVDKLVMYSMKEPFEKADNCVNLYHKSLLYLVYYGLEDKRATPILGLEECLWRDADMKQLFGLGASGGKAEAIWSETPVTTGLGACRATSHGAFDDDASTMSSALRHVLAIDDNVPIKPSPALVQGGRSMELKQPAVATKIISAAVSDGVATLTPMFQTGATTVALSGGGQRRAICVGINAYPGVNQLYGCVPDAQLWARTLGSLGFQTQLLLDANATYNGLLSALKSLVTSSKRGDVIVFQYSGHGTSIPHGARQEPDEAMVPFDFFTTGALLLDKELASVFSAVPDGVNLTCFFDCCHSGDLDRLLLSGTTSRPRFIHLTASQLALYNQFAGNRALQLSPSKTKPGTQRDISFAACSRSESALETNGQGEFSQRATDLIRKLQGTVSNSQFKANVMAAFGPAARQHPELDGAVAYFESPFLQPLDTSSASSQPSARVEDQPMPGAGTSTAQLIAKTLRAVADQIDAGR
ncbi:MAG: caspase family protein [Bryobacteraceae bacterium]